MNFIDGSTVEVAKALLGKKIMVYQNGQLTSGYIVETEAYLGPNDMACHSYGWRRTPKVASMYEPAGTIYVYSMHGHNMLNVVTRAAGMPEAVLIRAIQPVDGLDLMMECRGVTGIDVTNGPGKLCKAMGITREFDGLMLGCDQIYIDKVDSKIPITIGVSARIGIPNKGEWTDEPLRYYVAGNPYVSRLPKRMMKEVNETWEE